MFDDDRQFESNSLLPQIHTPQVQSKRNFINVIALGISFMFLFSAYNTAQNLITSVLKQEHFNDLGFYSLLIIYASVFILKPAAPAIVKFLGEKWAMIIGSLCYCALLAALIHVTPIAVYITSAILGFGGSILWVGNGSFLTLNSTPETRGKNAGLFWSIFQLSGILGNLGAFFVLYFTNIKIEYLMWGFLVLGVLSSLIMLVTFRKPDKIVSHFEDESIEIEQQSSSLVLLKDFLSQRNAWLLLGLNLFVGLEMSFNVGSFTKLLDLKLIGLFMALYSGFEVIGGVGWGRLADRFDRRAIFGIGLMIYLTGLALSFLYKLNLPHLSGVHAALPYLIVILLGSGDSCFNVIYYSATATAFDKSLTATAFAVFQMVQALGSAAGFLCAVYFPLGETCNKDCRLNSHGSFLPLAIASIGCAAWLMFQWMREITTKPLDNIQ